MALLPSATQCGLERRLKGRLRRAGHASSIMMHSCSDIKFHNTFVQLDTVISTHKCDMNVQVGPQAAALTTLFKGALPLVFRFTRQLLRLT